MNVYELIWSLFYLLCRCDNVNIHSHLAGRFDTNPYKTNCRKSQQIKNQS